MNRPYELYPTSDRGGRGGNLPPAGGRGRPYTHYLGAKPIQISPFFPITISLKILIPFS